MLSRRNSSKKRAVLPVFAAVLCTMLYVSCASFYIRGSTPVKRADSAAVLLLSGNVSDGYIQAYRTESALAQAHIENLLQQAQSNPVQYAAIADEIDDWIALHRSIAALHTRYPNGLTGKKIGPVLFEPADYTGLKAEANIRAAEALFESAKKTAAQESTYPEKALKSLPLLTKAKSYSQHLNDSIDLFGAELCISAADYFSRFKDPDTLMSAVHYYRQAETWVSGYKNAAQKAEELTQKAAYLYKEKGDRYAQARDYASLRAAKQAYLQAEKIRRGIAAQELASVNKKLTVSLTIVFSRPASYLFFNEDRIRNALKREFTSFGTGPESVDIRFAEYSGSYGFLFAENYESDLVLLPADDFGTVKESYGPISSAHHTVSKTINSITYTGTVTEKTQTVTVSFQNKMILYDMRYPLQKEIAVFYDTEYRNSQTFILRSYSGDEQAKPEDFTGGALYRPGEYHPFFPDFNFDTAGAILLDDSFRLNKIGKQLCRTIADLPYTESRKSGF